MIGKKEIETLLHLHTQLHDLDKMHVEKYLERNGHVYLISTELKLKWRVSKRIFNQFNLAFSSRPFLNVIIYKFSKAFTAI
jgi:hypothetical protein